MLDLQQIKLQYPAALQSYERGILREYLQYKILQGIFESKMANRVSFMGGTALRILYGNNRFSEDIDLDNFGLSWQEFEKLVEGVQYFLTLEGFEVALIQVEKAAYHCNIRFPHILYDHGISPLPGAKVLVQIDPWAQGYDYAPEVRILNKFDVFTEVRTTPSPILLSQKIYAVVSRKRPKGRDFYDITFLLAQTKPNYGYLEQMLGAGTAEGIRKLVMNRIAGMDMRELADDVAPFLISAGESKRVSQFKIYWENAILA